MISIQNKNSDGYDFVSYLH